MEAPVVPEYLYEAGVVSVERIGHSSVRSSWRLDIASGASKVLRNSIVDRSDVTVHRDRVVSTLELGCYGPPGYEYSEMQSQGGTVILVEVREYAAGATLEEFMQFASESEMDDICGRLEEMISAHGSVVSPVYGALGSGITANKCVEYMRQAKRSHACTRGRQCYLRRARSPRECGQARLCHNSLTPDHIIIHSGRIVSVIGWSRCSFGPMQMQAASYAYMIDAAATQGSVPGCLREIMLIILDAYSGKGDKATRFCMLMHACRVASTEPERTSLPLAMAAFEAQE
ncbi:hypothetical protein BBP40_010725 [Aspergillus hancockii]|nr:hypothetical protein BBP40_010725 [Aspergillus hancockii]